MREAQAWLLAAALPPWHAARRLRRSAHPPLT